MLHQGIWLVKTANELPYAKKEECDLESYSAALTFAID